MKCKSMYRTHLRRRGFTLLEALMASGVLLAVICTVSMAITAGQQNALEAHQRIAGTMAAEELMGRLLSLTYADLDDWDGHAEAVGTMTDINGATFPPTYDTIGREVVVTTSSESLPGLSVTVNGREVRVRSFNTEGSSLATLVRFIPEPAEDTL